jgi:hypothetical protein
MHVDRAVKGSESHLGYGCGYCGFGCDCDCGSTLSSSLFFL